MIVAGPHAAAFDDATAPTVTGSNYHGSDHRPVMASADFDREIADTNARVEALMTEIEVRLEEIRRY